jgi:hypothetical protein
LNALADVGNLGDGTAGTPAQPRDLARIGLEVHQELGEPRGVVPTTWPTREGRAGDPSSTTAELQVEAQRAGNLAALVGTVAPRHLASSRVDRRAWVFALVGAVVVASAT